MSNVTVVRGGKIVYSKSADDYSKDVLATRRQLAGRLTWDESTPWQDVVVYRKIKHMILKGHHRDDIFAVVRKQLSRSDRKILADLFK